MTKKDLINNEELVKGLVEELDEVPEDATVEYEVWAVGYDSDDCITDAETLMGTFEDPESAIAAAEKITLADIIWQAADDYDGSAPADVAYISIEVETVFEDDEGDWLNAGTIYQREIRIDDDEDTVIALLHSDYEVLEDNTLKVKVAALKGCNKNDIILIDLVGITETFPMEYKIVSKVMYEDGDYYHCELTY